jgi:hypothetical protein
VVQKREVCIPTYNVGTRVNMDPITAVLVAAIADGAVEVGKSAVAATYNNVTITGGIHIS